MTSENPQSCGEGLAHHAPLPRALARVLQGMSATLESHLASLSGNEDTAARAESRAYKTLMQEGRNIADQLLTFASELEGYRTLAPAPHDESKLGDGVARESFAQFVQAQKSAVALMQTMSAEGEAMLAEWKAG